MTHRPRKRFGQNFLQNQQIIHSILQAFHPQPNDHVIEIGPGLGALTKPLLHYLNALTAIEIDTDLHAHLQAMPQAAHALHLVNADALTIDYALFGDHLRIIGNLPYNISTPLLFHLLQFAPFIDDMHFMLQKEVVERIASEPGQKSYGRLSVMVQYSCEVEQLFSVPPSAFYPQPKVESAIVRLIPYKTSPYAAVDRGELERLLACAFAMRRKTLANNLKSIMSASELMRLDIDPTRRPEDLTIADYVLITRFLAKNK